MKAVYYRAALLGCCLPLIASALVDENTNGLSDVWEQRFNAGNLTQLGDEDADNFTNVQECIAGTDPFDPSDKPALQSLSNQNENEVCLEFQTVPGKRYSIYRSEDLSNFQEIPFEWIGDGHKRQLICEPETAYQTREPIEMRFWGNFTGTSIDELLALPNFPDAPDGRIFHSALEAPLFLATEYAAQMETWIEVPETGYYTLFLSSGGPAELSARADTAPDEWLKLAEILPAQTGLKSGDWTTYGTQRSILIPLEAGQRFKLRLRYVARVPLQHCETGWQGPGSTEILKIPLEAIATMPLITELFNYNYDALGDTTLWPDNTSLQTAPSGMSGLAEYITGDPGTNSTAERISFERSSETDFYGTWLYQMLPGHDDISFLFMDGSSSSREGPRIQMEERSNGSIAAVRAGGSGGNEVQINTAYNQSFRVELLATVDSEGLDYTTPDGDYTVAPSTFDLYVSDTAGNLVGSARGLTFRDIGTVKGFSVFQAAFASTPNIYFDAFDFTDGHILGDGYLTASAAIASIETDKEFFKLSVEESDQDGDGLMDWEELELAAFNQVLFFDSETSNGISDSSVITSALEDAQGEPHIKLYASDAAAYESNYPNTIADHGEITLTREGNLAPVTVQLCIEPLEATGDTPPLCDGLCCILVGSAGEEAAEAEDYQLIDEDGNVIDDQVHFEFGETSKVLTVIATLDSINEYPETLNIAAEPATDGNYSVSELLNGASIQLIDLPENPDNVTIFTGNFSPDGRAATATSGSGFVTATINGPRTEMRIWDEFSGLTSAQQDSHVHKANPGNTPGSILYAITETPGDETTDPLNGALVDYPWDLSESSGAVSSTGGSASKQVIIDSLFGQNSETPLYLNIHTVDNPAGEIWAFFNLSGGSATDPGDAAAPDSPGSTEYPQLAGQLLEAEVRRFLNQATFGANDSQVAALLGTIETNRQSDPSYHRHTAYEAWIDTQMNAATTPQTFLLDYTLASQFQFITLAGIFDPTLNPSNELGSTPTEPNQWPIIDRSAADPEHWYLSEVYPLVRDDLRLASSNGFNAEPGNSVRRNAHWQMMLNAKDQLRHKMGFALQQIVVASESLSTIRDNALGSANYQDMLNRHAFDYYRDVLGYVNWSPIMGKWLSSLQNQKAIDFDGDGLFDSYPDENLARENMQLFSIGLFEQWSDGSLKLTPNGLPKASYTNEDIREFARVLTGQSFSRYNSYFETWGGTPFTADNTDFFANQGSAGILAQAYLYPMQVFGDYHSLGPKHFAGVEIDNSALNNPTLEGIADIEAAVDWLAGRPGDGLPDFDMVHSHVSTPAFISLRLIQRFTTSNPSQEYLHRVATVFKNSEGDLGLTLKAILLDPEARQIDLNDTTFGMKKSPLEAYVQMLRSLESYTLIPLEAPQVNEAPFNSAPGDYTNTKLYLGDFEYPAAQLNQFERNLRFLPGTTVSSSSRALQMDPFRQETVFNFYLPNYNPGGAIGAAGLVAPEMQLANEQDIVRNINYFEDITRSTLGPGGDELGGNNTTQANAFNSVDAANHDIQRLARQELADAFYPSTAPAPANGRSSESLADEALLDALDQRLTLGLFKQRYPYDPSDDDDPNTLDVDDSLKNPRELIIDAISNAYSDPYNGSNDANDRLNKFSDALYLLTFSPEYQIRK